MKSSLRGLLVFFATGMMTHAADAPGAVTDEIPTGFLPQEWVNAGLRKSLSPQGRATMVSATGPVRVADAPERIAAARAALEQLQKAPAVVPIEVTFTTSARRGVQRLPVEPPVVSNSIPVPDRYDPPKIIAGPGGMTVVPSQPRSFTTRNVGPGTVVNPSPTGYQTRDPEVRMTETETVASGPARRFAVSTVLGKPVLASVHRQVPDPAALRALAVKYGAVGDTEPAWSAAGTELVLTPEVSGAAVVVKVVPQIVLPPAISGQPVRRVPITACSAGIMVARGAQRQTGILPKTDPEFYRVFLGMPGADDDTFTSVTVAADVQYLGSPPQ